jgi:hypothetical protein
MDNIIKRIERAIQLAENLQSELTEDILNIEGMSGKKNRHFLNNLLTPDDTYLEVGSWKGSTLVSALYPSPVKKCKKYFAIDNFSEFTEGQNIENTFKDNFKKHLLVDPNIICADSFSLNLKDNGISDISVYLYDGNHHGNSHYDALHYFSSAMSDNFIYLVDDWFCPFLDMRNLIQERTRSAISDLNLKTMYFKEITQDKKDDAEGWWNGIGIFYFSK